MKDSSNINSLRKTKLLVICGPTSTGKTSLGIQIASKFRGEIISADSRQVYKEMTIGTGKEYSSTINIWGYDLVNPNEDFSVGHFISYAKDKTHEISDKGKLPILVGGTGLYIRGILHDFETSTIPPNEQLRQSLSNKSVKDLFYRLTNVNREKALSMNKSDRQNPRRLIRAIEISMAKNVTDVNIGDCYDSLQIGLTSDIQYLFNCIEKSVIKRLENGFEKEVSNLLKKYPLSLKSMSATGYQEIGNFILGKGTREEAINNWITSEKKYVKRQLTWFKKDKSIHWFDIKSENYKDKVAEMVKAWENN